MPTFIEYSHTNMDYERNLFLQQLGFGIWPLAIVAGIAWGFMTDRKPFAKGLISGSVICLALPVLAYIDAIFSGGLR